MGQTDALYENLTAYENLDFFGHLSELKGKELEDNIKKNMSLVDLENTLNKRLINFQGNETPTIFSNGFAWSTRFNHIR